MRILRGNPDDDGPADNTCHCEMRATCFPEGGVPTKSILPTFSIYFIYLIYVYLYIFSFFFIINFLNKIKFEFLLQ